MWCLTLNNKPPQGLDWLITLLWLCVGFLIDWLIVGLGLGSDWLWEACSGLEWGRQSQWGERGALVVPVICLLFYPWMLLSSSSLGIATLCPCPGHLSGAPFSPLSVTMCLCSLMFTCVVAWSSICPVLARKVVSDIRSLAFSKHNKYCSCL